LDFEPNIKIDDENARALIKQYANVKHIHEIQRLEKGIRDDLVKKIKAIEGLSLRQIARITGLSYYQIQKVNQGTCPHD
jgi:putative transposase